MKMPSRAALALVVVSAGALAESPIEPRVERTVIEDDGARIEELRVRGQVQRVLVRPKGTGARPYEILPQQRGSDPSQRTQQAGQRVWNLLSF